ncbi:hypothetical protein [Microcystis phage Mel-JY34]
MITFTSSIRGVEVQVEADDFFEDRSVGVPLGPESLSIEQLCAKEDEITLTDSDYARMSQIATEKYMEQL